MPFVYSTATADSIFAVYAKTEAGQAGTIKRQVLIRGGANLAKGRGELITKYGVRTEVSDVELEQLRGSVNFRAMVEAGFLRVDERKRNPEEVAADMEARDESAPLVPQDYNDADIATPIVKDAPEFGGNGKHAEDADEE